MKKDEIQVIKTKELEERLSKHSKEQREQNIRDWRKKVGKVNDMVEQSNGLMLMLLKMCK